MVYTLKIRNNALRYAPLTMTYYAGISNIYLPVGRVVNAKADQGGAKKGLNTN